MLLYNDLDILLISLISIYCLLFFAVTIAECHLLLTILVSSSGISASLLTYAIRLWLNLSKTFSNLAKKLPLCWKSQGTCQVSDQMEGTFSKQEKEKAQRTVRFRVASANSGRVLTEVFREVTSGSVWDSGDSDCTSNSEIEGTSSPPTSEANGHLSGLLEAVPDDSGSEPDDLLMYASVKRERLFSNKRVNICSKNGTVRGVRNKVSAGQVLYNNLSNMYAGNLRGNQHLQRKRP